MPTTTTISPIEQFRELFSEFHTWGADEPVLYYPFIDIEWAERAADKARRIILENSLPLIARAIIKKYAGKARCVMVVEDVPEEYVVMDEVPGEVMEPDWWGSKERE